MAKNQNVATFLTQSDEFMHKRHKLYKSLDPDQREIRLAHIEPGQYEDDIHLTLSAVDLTNEPFYEAISYTWEDMSITERVYIHDVGYNVTVNQHRALRRLRLTSETRILWMDVVCIDQTNYQERSHQVSIMGDVYANAARTIVWLGEFSQSLCEPQSDREWDATVSEFEKLLSTTDWVNISLSPLGEELKSEFLGINGAIERVEFVLRQLSAGVHLGDLPYCSRVGEETILCRAWHDTLNVLFKILHRPWWTRVWVLQEVLLCKGDPEVLFGSFTLPFSSFTEAVDGLGKHALERCCIETLVTAFHAKRLPRNFLQLADLTGSAALDEPGHMDMYKAVLYAEGRNVSDNRDHVYGVLGLVEPEDRVEVDYTLTTSDVFASASWYMLYSRKTLDWLHKGALPSESRTPSIPTWSADWANVDTKGFKHFDRFAMDEEPDWTRTRYDEDLELVANRLSSIRMVIARYVNNDSIDTIQNIYTRLRMWIERLEDAGYKIDVTKWTVDEYHNDQVFFEFFAATLCDTVARLTEDETNIETQRLAENDWLAVVRWWIWLNRYVEEGNKSAHDVKEHFEIINYQFTCADGYTLALTTDNRLCLVPESSKVGDSIYHIRSCGAPMILREAGEDVFQVVGPAYLRGSMGSEGWNEEEERVISLI